MASSKTIPSITFAVDDVTPENELLETYKSSRAVLELLCVETREGRVDEAGQRFNEPPPIEACWNYSLNCINTFGVNPVIGAAHFAFSEHRPLVLSPDVIWVTIVQGLAQHVRLNPEAYRDTFVRHQGKKTLEVIRDDLHFGSPENLWDEVIADFSQQLRAEVGDFIKPFVCDFSTTGPVERTVSEVALMDVVQPYYQYEVRCICGIPNVTLEGTPDDWSKLRDKIELLSSFDLDWWLEYLRPICDHFVSAAKGQPDISHWQRLYKLQEVYGHDMINGWIGELFPYLMDWKIGSYSRRNRLLTAEMQGAIEAFKIVQQKRERLINRGLLSSRYGWNDDTVVPGESSRAFAFGISRVPFAYNDRKRTVQMQFMAGPVVVTQDPLTLALRPTLGWFVSQVPTAPTLESSDREPT